jgi:hypothetical protein
MVEKRKVGRPRKYGDEKLGKTYFVRFTDEQYKALKNAAAGAGVSVADYIRLIVDGEVMDILMNGEKNG